MRNLSLLLIAAVLVATGVYAAGVPALGPLPVQAQAGPRYGGTLRIGMQTDPVGLDPHLSTATATRNMLEHVYETLALVSPDGRLVPGLAESWRTSQDNLTWTFTLRRNVKFHNGRPLTADDVVYSINRVRDPRTRSPWAGNFTDVDTITAPDAYTVVFRLKKPFAPLLAKLGGSILSSAIVAKEVVEKDEMQTNPVGTGPFRFVGYTPQQRLTLVRSGDYWETDATGRRLPYLDRIEFVFFPDAVARATAIRTGTVDFIEYVPSSEVRALRGDANVDVLGGPSANFRAIYINNANAPFNNVKVRQAMAWAINRKEIIDTALFGVGGIDATGFVIPPGNFYAASKNVYDKVDLDRAKRLLAEAGVPNGFEAPFYVTSTYDFLRTPAEIVQAQLARVGIRLRIQAADWSVYLPAVRAKQYSLTILGTSGQVDPDDYLYNNFKTGDARNFLNFSDATFDRLVEEGQTIAGEAQRKRIYDQAQLRALEVVPMVMLFHSTTFEAVRKNVQGFEHQINQSYLTLRRTWMTGR
jgi:peptide/nickel transport system substrate-binding protein